jgi:hypothetical protein
VSWARTSNRASLAGLAAACVVLLGSATPLLPLPLPSLGIWQQVDRRCGHYAREKLAPYPWPIKPFNEQHPVRGDFGDPRTVLAAGDAGLFSFHNGVDISAWTGNRVYPVVSGTVVQARGDLVVIHTVDARRFQYIHVRPFVHKGEHVVASKTILGTVRARWDHVHLSELRGPCSVNPLMAGHLTPYVDQTTPTVRAILFQTPLRTAISPRALTGKIRILADAYDTPALPSPYPWLSLPVAPVRITWSLATLGGRHLIRDTAVDFRYSEPFRFQFCSVYAPGTEQNFAAVLGTFHWGKPGRYLFDLTPNLLNTAFLPDGRYRVTVKAEDTAGNWGSRSTIVEIDQGPARPLQLAPDKRCAGAPVPTLAARSGYYGKARN